MNDFIKIEDLSKKYGVPEKEILRVLAYLLESGKISFMESASCTPTDSKMWEVVFSK